MSAIARMAGRWSGTSAQRLVEVALRLGGVAEALPGRARQIGQHRGARVRVAGDLELAGQHPPRLVPVRLGGEHRRQRVQRLGVVRILAQRRLEASRALAGIVELLAVDAAGVEQRLDRLRLAGQRLGLAHARPPSRRRSRSP